LAATYSFEVDGNTYYSEGFQAEAKKTSAAYEATTDKPNDDYKF
jgi:hypothetical protein